MTIKKVERTIEKYGMLKKGDRVVVGVSGGPDSMALLYVMTAIGSRYKLKLVVAHLDHMIRGGESAKDAQMVKTVASKLHLPVVMESINVPKVAKQSKQSIEEAGRQERYGLFLRVAKKFNANKIALGHTADDQAETVIMRLIRGTGLLGLAGIPPTRRLKNTVIIRPLIETKKDALICYLVQNKIKYLVDKTNKQNKFFRNRVRNKLIPYLESEYNPNITNRLSDMAHNMRIDYQYLQRVVVSKFKKYARKLTDTVVLRAEFLNEDYAVQRLLIREAIKLTKGNLDSVSFKHIDELRNLTQNKQRWSLDIPGGIVVRRKGNYVVFSVFSEGPVVAKQRPVSTSYELKIPGRTKIKEAGKVIEASVVNKRPDFSAKKSSNEEYFDSNCMSRRVMARFRAAQDKIIPLGMKKYKRIKQLFIDEKIPLDERNKTPIIVSGDRILWVCGVKRSDIGKVFSCTKEIVKLKLKKAFTLVEIMIVVAIIGLIAAISTIHFATSRVKSTRAVCTKNIRAINTMACLWALDTIAGEDTPITMNDLVPDYIRKTPYCPFDGSHIGYTMTTVGDYPTCPAYPLDHNVD